MLDSVVQVGNQDDHTWLGKGFRRWDSREGWQRFLIENFAWKTGFIFNCLQSNSWIWLLGKFEVLCWNLVEAREPDQGCTDHCIGMLTFKLVARSLHGFIGHQGV